MNLRRNLIRLIGIGSLGLASMACSWFDGDVDCNTNPNHEDCVQTGNSLNAVPTATPRIGDTAQVVPTTAPARPNSSNPTATPSRQQSAPASQQGGIWGAGIKHISILQDTGPKPALKSQYKVGAWTVYDGLLTENPIVGDWIDRLRNPNPSVWKTFPNILNPDVPEFPTKNCFNRPNALGVSERYCEVPQGMQFGVQDSPFCETHPCDFVVPAWEYRIYTGDYSFGGYMCEGTKRGEGCMLVVINVMDESVIFRDQYFDNGWTMHGRYWDGDNLEWGVVGLVSHAAANMLNMPTYSAPGEKLNFGDPGNSGANCGTPDGCKTIDVRVIVVAGTQAIAVLEADVSPNSK